MNLRRVLLVAAAMTLLASACSSSDEPVVPITGPTLTTVPPIGSLPLPDTGSRLTTPPTRTTAPTVPITAPPLEDPKPGVERFVPTIQLEDGILSLELVFVDGSTSSIEWPATLDLSSRGLIPYGWAFVPGGSSRDLFVRPGTIEAVISNLGGADLLGDYPDGQGSSVGLWRLPDDGVDYLGFQFGNWAVFVFDYRAEELRMSEEHRALWATNFHGEQNEQGFLVLSADQPLQLVFAGDYPVPLSMTMRGNHGEVTLTPGACDSGIFEEVGDDAFAVWCVESGNMTVQAFGTSDFQQAVFDGLVVNSVVIADPPPPQGNE